MAITVYTALLSFGAATLECVLGTLGLKLPLIAPLLFYFSCAFGWKYGLACAGVFGVLLDFSSGLEHPWSVPGLCLVCLLAVIWLHRVESESLSLLCVPGLCLPLLSQTLPELVLMRNWSELPDLLSYAVFSGVLSAVFLPVAVILLDLLGTFFEFPLYSEARQRLRKGRLYGS